MHENDASQLLYLITILLLTAAVAMWSERSRRSREVAYLGPGRAKPKALKLILVVSSLDTQH